MITSCDKITEPPGIQQELIGTWEWSESTGGIAGIKLTPESSGTTSKLIITLEKVKTFKDGNLISEKNYTLSIRPSITSQTDTDQITIGDNYSQTIKIESDKLSLIDEVYDGYYNIYTRK